MQSQERLGTEKITKLLLSLAIPAVLAQIINLLYNVVDRFYIARLGSDSASGGLSVCFPIIMVVAAFSALIGMGGAPLASIKMGEGKMNDAEKIMGNSLTTLCVIATILTTILLIFRKPLLSMFGANAITMPEANSYLSIYMIGTIFVQISLGMNMFISAQGYAKTAMATVVIGAISNIVLDPIFIFTFKMGVSGAALATIISQGISGIWVVLFLASRKSKLRIKVPNLRLSPKIMLPVIALGVSPFIMQSTESLVQLVFNNSVVKFSSSESLGAIATAGMGVIFTVMSIISMPIMGIAQGAQPIISYNYGAKNIKRVKETFRLLLIISVIVTTSICALVLAFPKAFAIPLSSTAEVMNFSAKGLRIFMIGTFMLGFQFACQQTLVALGQAKVSLFLAFFRKIFLLIPLALILPIIFNNNKINALLVAEPIADIIAGITTTIVFVAITKKLFSKIENLLKCPNLSEKEGIETVAIIDDLNIAKSISDCTKRSK